MERAFPKHKRGVPPGESCASARFLHLGLPRQIWRTPTLMNDEEVEMVGFLEVLYPPPKKLVVVVAVEEEDTKMMTLMTMKWWRC